MKKRDGPDLYYANRHRLQTGDHIGWQSHTALGWAIRKFSGGGEPINHSSLVIRFKEYDSERVYVLEALDHGIVLRALSERLIGFKGRAWWYGLKPDFDDRRTAMGAWALDHVGVRYDWGSLLRNAIGKVSADATRFFCSEYWFMGAQSAGILPYIEGQKAPRPSGILELGVFDHKECILER